MVKTKLTFYVIIIKFLYKIISGLVFLTNGEHRLVKYKMTLGMLILSFGSNPLFSQQNNPETETRFTKNDSLRFDVILEDYPQKRNEVVVMCYFGGEPRKRYVDPNLPKAIARTTPSLMVPTTPLKIADLRISNFIIKHLRYPSEALKKQVEGNVEIQFTITKEYGVKNVKIIKGIGYGCDKEAIRLVKSFPKELFFGDNIISDTVFTIYIYFKPQ